jgi:hypothetical protein
MHKFLYIDLAKAGPKFDFDRPDPNYVPKTPSTPSAGASGGSPSMSFGSTPGGGSARDMYDYEPAPKGDGRNWEAAPEGKGYRARKDDPGLKKPKPGVEEAPGEPKDITGDSDKTISSAPGVSSKQSILSKDPKDFKDHSVADHYKIMHEVGHDKKLWEMHHSQIKEKTKGLTADEHQKISDEMAEAHAEHGHESFKAAAFIHGQEAASVKKKAEKTKEDVSAETGQKDLESQAGAAKLEEEAKKPKQPLTVEETKAAQEKTKAERKKIDDQHKKSTDAYKKDKEKFEQGYKKKHLDAMDAHKDHVASKPVPPTKVNKPKASDYKDGKVPAKDKAAYDKFQKDKAAHSKAHSEWKTKEQELKNARGQAKNEYDRAKEGRHDDHPEEPQHPGYGEHEEMPQMPESKEGEEQPRAPGNDMEQAQLDHHNKETQRRLDNLQSHMDSGALDEQTKKVYNNLINSLNNVKDKKHVYSKEEIQIHKTVDQIAGEHSKKHATETGGAPAKGGGDKPAAGSKKPADKGPNIMGAFRSGRRLGQKLGDAAADEKGGGGSIGEAAFNYAGAGAAMLGHKLLSKQSAKPPKEEREESGKKASQTGD